MKPDQALVTGTRGGRPPCRVADLVLLSLRQLGKNKLRSLLTVLGIVIGIAAVTVMVSIGQGGQALIQNAVPQPRLERHHRLPDLDGEPRAGSARAGPRR